MYKGMGNAEVVFIDRLFVDEEHRKNSIGSMALQEIERMNPNCANFIQVTV